MDKEELRQYMNEAIDALGSKELEMLFPKQQQPDLYSIVAELTGLRGEVRKLSNSNLMLNNHLHTSIENQHQEWAKLSDSLTEKTESQIRQISDDDVKSLLSKLIEQDDNLQRTAAHFKELPELTFWGLNDFKQKFSAWKNGFEITFQQWNTYFQQVGIYRTGMVGEIFNPLYHEVIQTKKDPRQKDNLILETEIPGILFQQNLIRRARVVVNKI